MRYEGGANYLACSDKMLNHDWGIGTTEFEGYETDLEARLGSDSMLGAPSLTGLADQDSAELSDARARLVL